MNKSLKIILAALLFVGVFTKDKICNHLGYGQKHQGVEVPDSYREKEEVVEKEEKEEIPDDIEITREYEKGLLEGDEIPENNYSSKNTIYRWDEQLKDWVPTKKTQKVQAQLPTYSSGHTSSSTPIEIDWKILMNIEYKLRYFEEIESEIFAPIFSKAVQALHGKEVIIKGYVIPLDPEGDLLALSFNPFASCFFCGKASPASVISVYVRDKSKRYKTDDLKTFKGTLFLNQDDPNEFYYILRDAVEE